MAFADIAELGVLDDADEPLRSERKRITPADNPVTLVVDRHPAKVGIDSRHTPIERQPKDNNVTVMQAPL